VNPAFSLALKWHVFRRIPFGKVEFVHFLGGWDVKALISPTSIAN